MKKFRIALIMILITVVALSAGCVKKSETELKIIEDFQAFLDTPYDVANEKLLTPEERAAIESFQVYRSTLKIQLVQGTETVLVEPVGRKTISSFATICRGYNYLYPEYRGQIRIKAIVDDKESNFLIADVVLHNRNDRIDVQEYNPSRE